MKGVPPAARSARIAFDESSDVITVEVRGLLSPDDMVRLSRDIVGVIERLTGHPCLSGTHQVVLKPQYAEVLDVTFR